MSKSAGRLSARRSTARLFALQALYEIALSGRAAADVIENFLTSRIAEETAARGYEPPDKRLFRDLVTGAAREAHRWRSAPATTQRESGERDQTEARSLSAGLDSDAATA